MRTKAVAVKKKTSKTTEAAPRAGWLALLKRESFILGLLLVVGTVAVYVPVGHHPFVNYDDMVYVVNNPHIQSGLDGETIAWAFTTFYQFNWHPLTWLSHAIDVQMFQLEPGGHHVTNLLLQMLNVLLLFWVLVRATGYVGRSAMVAGLFALHPVNVESVAWISERKNLLSMLFFLLGLGAYRWYASSQPGGNSPPKTQSTRLPGAKTALLGSSSAQPSRVGRYIILALLFAMGLMSKPQIITFPFLLLLWDYWPLQRMATASSGSASGTLTEPLVPRRSFWWLVKEKIPLFAICAASAVVTVIAQKKGGAVVSLQTYPFSIRLTNAIVAYVRYVGKAFWPTHLVPIYPHPWHPLPLWQVIPALLLLLAITALTIVGRSHRYLVVGWLWFLGTLVPMIGLVHVGNQAMADRYAYLPFIGLFIMVCWGVSELAERRHVPVIVLRCAGVIVLLVLAVVTHHQLAYWNDNVTLWTHAIEASTDNYIAHDNLALLLLDRGQSDDAMKHFHAALAIYPSDPTSNLQIAVYDHQHGRLQEAIARYDQMISETPDGPGRAELFSNKGLVYLDLRDSAHAQENLDKAVALDPHNYRGWLGLGVLAVRSGDLNLAIEDFQRSNTAKPTEIAYGLLAQALDQAGRKDEAQAARQRAKLLAKNAEGAEGLSEGLLAH
ncbi:MAG: tetratricopeptide repeat protein [Candidatus Korobacteraceae bacterium]